MKKIEIRNLRHITHLEFELPPAGVYLLAGQNGAGKSSLLACLLRLGDRNAFPRYFRPSKISDRLDQFGDASIAYKVGQETVTYSYAGQRWVPLPRRNSALLKSFGYSQVLHIAADSQRIEPRPEDFKLRKVKDAPEDIRRAAEAIFDNIKFRNLKIINIRRGVGTQAFLLQEPTTQHEKQRFYSEKNFSLGELCVVKLLRDLKTCANGSLLLIDELELALHPRAQVGLLSHLGAIAKEKGLTVIFSTHSPSLIRRVPRDNVLFLSAEDEGIKCIRGCYPAFALGQIAVQGENSPDIVLYVEDDAAKSIVSQLVTVLLEMEFKNAPRPTVVIFPIGSFRSVVQFLSRSENLLPNTTQQFALLDKDVETESLENLRSNNSYRVLSEFEKVKLRLRYLPWTPEVGLAQHLSEDTPRCERKLRDYLSDQRISLDRDALKQVGAKSGKSQRDCAKKSIRSLVKQLSGLRNCDENRSADDLAGFFARELVSDANSCGKIKALFLPLLKAS